MLLLQHHSNSINTFLSGLRGVIRFGVGSLALLLVCTGVSSGQSQAPWQSSPRSSRALEWQNVSAQAPSRGAVRDVSRKVTKKSRAAVAYDKKVVQTSGDEAYVLDPVPDGQTAETVGEPMMMPGGGMYGDVYGDPARGDRMYSSYHDPAVSHPWQGGEYWFNPRHGLPPFMCRFPHWMRFSRNRLWVRGEYLLWWMNGSDTPALVTTSPGGTPIAQAGVLGGNTTVLSGDEKMNTEAQSGGRISLGYWFTDAQCFGWEINYLGMGESLQRFSTDSSATPIIARPFTNAVSGAQDATQLSYPGVLTGSVEVESTAEFQSFEFLFRRAMVQRCDYRVDFLIGYRHGRLDDRLTINDYLKVTGRDGPAPEDTIFAGYDTFQTENTFNGAEIGIVANRRYGRWSFEFLTKLALGRASSKVDIYGGTTITQPDGASTAYVGNLLALPTNIGSYETKEFSVMPEVGLNLMYNITPRTSLKFGYNIIYMGHVARPGDQIDMHVNTTQFPPGALAGVGLPEFQFQTSGFWAHGMNIGFDARF